jgi:hypothetical protein
MQSRIPSLLLAGMAVAGLVYASAGQSALAHNFSGDESANFISTVEKAKVHLQLASKNLRNSEVALAHIDSASMHFDEHVVKEIAEKNQRIAKDLPVAFDKLKTMVLVKSSTASIKKQIGQVNGLLGEAITARIDRAQLRDGDVQTMVFAQMVSQALQAYEHASGAMAEEHDNAPASSEHAHSSSSSHNTAGVHDKQAHETSKAFVSKASTMYSKVKRLAPEDSADEMAKVKAGLRELRNAINHHEPLDKVTIIVHGKIHDSLIKAFDLKLPAEEEEKEHGHEEGDHMAG